MLGPFPSSSLLALVLYTGQGQTQLDIATTVPVPAATAPPLSIPNENIIYQPALGGAVNTLTETQQWLAEVQIGTQRFNLIVDTGSSDL